MDDYTTCDECGAPDAIDSMIRCEEPPEKLVCRECYKAARVALTPGVRADVDALVWTGWTEGDGTGHEGYHYADYFDASGVYLGPDAHGIEPLFVARRRRKTR